MSASTPVNLVKMQINNAGTGPLVLGMAVPAFRGTSALVDGETYSYSIQSGSNWEYGTGTYIAAISSLTRGVIGSSNGNAALDLSGPNVVSFTFLAEDLVIPGPPGRDGHDGTPGVTGPAGTVINNGFWTTLEQYYGAADGTTDNTIPLNNALAALYSAGGGTILLAGGTYLVNGRITLPNDGTRVGQVNAASVPISIIGAGNDTDCAAGAVKTPKGTNLKLAFQDAAGWAGIGARLQAIGRGTLRLRSLNLISPDTGVGIASTPFIYTSATSLDIDSSVSFWGPSNRTGVNADCDAIILGGTVAVIDNTNNGAFQGYATNLGAFYCSAIRRAAYLRTYCNGIKISGPVMWLTCGTNLANGAAIEIDGLGDNSSGNLIHGPLVEVVNGYKYMIKLTKALNNTIIAPNAFDAGVTVDAIVRCEATASANIVIAGMQLSARVTIERPTLSEATPGTNVLISNRATEKSQMLNLRSGTNGYPNEFGDTLFTSGNAPTDFQPGGAGVGIDTAVAFRVVRPGAAASSPGAVAFQVDTKGGFTFVDANSASSGNVTASAPGQIEFGSQGKVFGFDGPSGRRGGANMKWDTGSGGSYARIWAYGLELSDHTGTLGVKVDQARGGIGAAGIVFGAALDVELYRLDANNLRASKNFDIAATMVYKINGVQVIAGRDPGWTVDTGTARKAANTTYIAGTTLTYSAAYVQAEQTAMATRVAAVETALQNATQTIKALKDLLFTTHGLIGA